MNIYVGNLSHSATESDLRNAFEKHGEVSRVNIPTDRETNQSRGFGFIEMPKSNEAQAAMTALNGTELNGRQISVNEARPKGEGGGGGGSRMGGGGGRSGGGRSGGGYNRSW
jgi:RNA recognition motif-containing protein